jgi:esterase/lipase superfamily enzyme
LEDENKIDPIYPKQSFVQALIRLAESCSEGNLDPDVRAKLDSALRLLTQVDAQGAKLAGGLAENPDWWTISDDFFTAAVNRDWLRHLGVIRQSPDGAAPVPSQVTDMMSEAVQTFAVSASSVLEREAHAGAEVEEAPSSFDHPLGKEGDEAYVRVSFCTTRRSSNLASRGQPEFYSREWARKRSHGIATVSVPVGGRVRGVMSEPSFWKRWQQWDPAKHVMVVSTAPLSRQDMLLEFRTMEKKSDSKRKQTALIFVHGFNVTFVDAVRRCGQIWYDLDLLGSVAICFSWPSNGGSGPLDYTHDSTEAERSPPAFAEFLTDLVDQGGFDGFYVVSHSMGNRPVTRALIELARTRPDVVAQVTELVLAAPDIDRDVFADQLAPELRKVCQRITLYASSRDLAMKLSKIFNVGPRAGDADPVPVVSDGIETIDVSAMGEDIFRHSYIGGSRSVLADLFQLFAHRHRPVDRYAMKARQTAGGTYWLLEA